ncbi:MAG: succinate--CoA ligase subunit alpha [Candidatus Dormiibacterota bacterium]
MAILVSADTGVLIQGITGRTGQLFATRMLAGGTRVLGGISPGRGGALVQGLPVFDTVAEAIDESGARTVLSCIGPHRALDGLVEAVAAGAGLVVSYIENVPVHDAILMRAYARARGTRLLGPNSAGIVTPRGCNLSDLNEDNLIPGPVGIVSKSGTLTYEVIAALRDREVGVSTVTCLGGDRVLGSDYADILPLYEDDPETRLVVVIGEPGGALEQDAARMAHAMSTPVVGFITGRFAPKEVRMGHVGAVVGLDGRSQPEAKVQAFKAAGCKVASLITDVAALVMQGLQQADGSFL